MMIRCLADECSGIEVWISAETADVLAFQIIPSVSNVGLGINKRRGMLEVMIGLYKEDMVHGTYPPTLR